MTTDDGRYTVANATVSTVG